MAWFFQSWGSFIGFSMFAALVCDALLGDPRRATHPVVLIGRFIAFAESVLRPICRTAKGERRAGAVLVIAVVTVTFTTSAGLLLWAWQVSSWLAFAVSVWGMYTAVAARALDEAAERVRRLLSEGRLAAARVAVGELVSRETAEMEEKEVVRACVETVSENTIDGVVSPVFYGLILGMPGAITYRAVNTLDAMLGYKNERYLHFGRAAARLDDWANWLPARLGGGLLLLSAWFRSWDVQEGWRSWRRDARRHPSPNAGIPEAVIAGVLGVRLGGRNRYHGKITYRAEMGPGNRSLSMRDIAAARQALRDITRLMAAMSLLTGLCASWLA